MLWMNRVFRFLIAFNLLSISILARIYYFLRINLFKLNQIILFKKYRVNNVDPSFYNKELEKRMDAIYDNRYEYAFTSGSSNKPKRILFNKKRISITKREYVLSLLNLLDINLSYKTLFIVSSMSEENSLSDMLTREISKINYFSLLQAPYRILKLNAFQKHLDDYTSESLKLFVFYISKPRYLYATNPSTLLNLHYACKKESSLRFLNDFIDKKLDNQSELESLVNKIIDRKSISRIEKCNSLLDLNDKLKGFISWDGGYVKPYLDDLLVKYSNLVHYPLFSMSTESVETLNFMKGFYPIYPRTLYEFLDTDDNIIQAWNLKVGNEYEMIISNQYGLVRYRTDDIFECNNNILNCPSLIFKRRKSLSHSFTGEKITGEQILMVYESISNKQVQISLLADISSAHYALAIISDVNLSHDEYENICNVFDQRLMDINFEYKSKRESNRLSKPNYRKFTMEEFISLIKQDKAENWISQFKFLPLYICDFRYLSE